MKSKIAQIGFLLFGANLLVLSPSFGEHGASDSFRRRPLARIREWIRGTDIKIFERNSNAVGYCQATPVAKNESKDNPGTCLVAYLSAAHCFRDPAKSISFENLGNVSKEQIRILTPQSFGHAGNFSKPGDTATLIVSVPCEQAENVKPVPLAPVNRDGTTAVSEGDTVYLQKRNEAVGGNRGEGAQIQAQMIAPDSNMFVFHAPSPQGYSIRKGDSGGPVFDSKGRLICPISGSSYENLVSEGRRLRPRVSENSILDPFEVLCDKYAIARVKQDLARFGLVPETDLSFDGEQPQRATQRAQTSPLLGSAGTLPGFGSSNQHGVGSGEGEAECDGESGVCRVPSSRPTPSHSDSDVQQQSPQASQRPTVEENSIPTRSTGGLVERAIEPNQLQDVLEQAKKDGFKHVIIRYGNDQTCPACRAFKNNLIKEFGKENDILVLKIDGRFSPIRGEGIPQSDLISLDSDGAWKKQGRSQIGAGAASTFRAQVNQLKRNQAQAPRENTPRPQGHQESTAPQQRQSLRPPQSEDSPSAPTPPQNVFNGFKFEPSEAHGGVHFLNPGENPSAQNGIFLKRQADGTRKAVRKESDGSLTVLPEKVQDGLRQYYANNHDKVAHLGEKEQRYIADFMKGFGSPNRTAGGDTRSTPSTPATPTTPSIPSAGSPSPSNATPARELPSGRSKSASSNPAPGHGGPGATAQQRTNDGYRNARPASAGSVPAQQGHSVDPAKAFERDLASLKGQSPLHTAIGRCLDCHSGESGRTLTLPDNPEKALESLKGKLTKFGPINPEMVVKMAESSVHGALKPEEKEALYQYLFNSSDAKQVAKLEEPARVPAQKMSQQELAALKETIPKTTNPFLDEILRSPSTLFYTDQERRPIYQIGKDTYGAGEGIKFRDTDSNLGPLGWKDFFQRDRATGDISFKGLFGSPAGLQDASKGDFRVVKFQRNPSEGGKTVPTQVFRAPSGVDSHLIESKFPEGMVFGEVVLVKDPTTGGERVLQIRTRTKTGENQWQPDIYTAFPTASSLSERIKSIWKNDEWKKDPELSRMVAHLEGPAQMIEKPVQSNYATPVYSGTGGVDELPQLSPQKIARLLNETPLDSSLNKRWRNEGGVESFAPTTQSQFHIVPKGYGAHTMEVSQQSCTRCHQDAGTNFGVINPHARRNDGAQFAYPNAYGHIYGSDGIFTWHPFNNEAAFNFGNGSRGAQTDNRYDSAGRLKVDPQLLRDGIISLGR